MWIIVHQNVLELRRTTLVTGTSLVPMVPLHSSFLSLLGFGSLHRLYIHEHCFNHSSKKTQPNWWNSHYELLHGCRDMLYLYSRYSLGHPSQLSLQYPDQSWILAHDRMNKHARVPFREDRSNICILTCLQDYNSFTYVYMYILKFIKILKT